MPRKPRIEYPGALYHITSRGNEKRDIFLTNDDRLSFLSLLSCTVEKFDWICHAYCLMDNHYHLLIETPRETLSIGMYHLNGIYARLFNKKYAKAGHLFEGRFKSSIVDKDSYLLEVARYIVLNPVRAGLVHMPGQWKWSSYNATAGVCDPHPALTTTWILSCIGQDGEDREQAYAQFVREGMQKRFSATPWAERSQIPGARHSGAWHLTKKPDPAL